MAARQPNSCHGCGEPLEPGRKWGNCKGCRDTRKRLCRIHKKDGPNWKGYRRAKEPLIVAYAGRAERGEPLFG